MLLLSAPSWFALDLREFLMVLVSTPFVYAAIIALTRLSGLRSFSKMSAPDFAMTVAVGSLFASTISSPRPTVLGGGAAFAALFFVQWLIAFLRERFRFVGDVLDNRPILLMRDGEMLRHNMRIANVSTQDLIAKLREKNVLRLSDVRAVVFETTGDVSVLHTTNPDRELEPTLLRGVRGTDAGANTELPTTPSTSKPA